MKKFIAISLSVLAIASIAFFSVATTKAAASEVSEVVDVSDVTVTAYEGNNEFASMSGLDCLSVFYVLPTNVKTQIATEWNKFSKVAKSKGTYAGVKYSFTDDKCTFQYGGCKVVATNLSPEEISKIFLKIE